MIVVCPLSQVEKTVVSTRAQHVITLLSAGTAMTRPASVTETNHLFLSMHDIAEPQEGMTLPGEEHMQAILDFADRWDRSNPLVVHCFAGISRSTATAYTIAAALSPRRSESELAQTLRRLSPTATPNPLLIALADQMLGREGRMVSAIAAIGRGADAYEGTPFMLDI